MPVLVFLLLWFESLFRVLNLILDFVYCAGPDPGPGPGLDLVLSYGCGPDSVLVFVLVPGTDLNFGPCLVLVVVFFSVTVFCRDSHSDPGSGLVMVQVCKSLKEFQPRQQQTLWKRHV